MQMSHSWEESLSLVKTTSFYSLSKLQSLFLISCVFSVPVSPVVFLDVHVFGLFWPLYDHREVKRKHARLTSKHLGVNRATSLQGQTESVV